MQPIHFSWHIVIYIIIIYHVPCGRTNILVSVYFVCRVSTSQNEGWGGNCSLSLWATTQVLSLSMIASGSCEKLSSLEIWLFCSCSCYCEPVCTCFFSGLMIFSIILFFPPHRCLVNPFSLWASFKPWLHISSRLAWSCFIPADCFGATDKNCPISSLS